MVSVDGPSLVLIAADVDGQIGDTLYDSPANASLALLAGRGTVRRIASNQRSDHLDWQIGLLTMLGLAQRDYPSAPVSFHAPGANTDAPDGYWLHADLVHLAAGMDRLTLTPLLGAATVTSAERAALAPLIVRHLEDSALRLRIGDRGAWFIHAQRPLDVVTSSPDAAAATDLNDAMPSGNDAAALRRALTEWQMVLHEHPVSARREQRGLPAINAVWPWGGGVLPTIAPRGLPAAYADDAFTRGICRLHGIQAWPVPADSATVLAQGNGSTVVVIEGIDLAGLKERWIAPAMLALRSGRITQLQVIIHRWQLQITRGQLRCFWRKPSLPSQWQDVR